MNPAAWLRDTIFGRVCNHVSDFIPAWLELVQSLGVVGCRGWSICAIAIAIYGLVALVHEAYHLSVGSDSDSTNAKTDTQIQIPLKPILSSADSQSSLYSIGYRYSVVSLVDTVSVSVENGQCIISMYLYQYLPVSVSVLLSVQYRLYRIQSNSGNPGPKVMWLGKMWELLLKKLVTNCVPMCFQP